MWSGMITYRPTNHAVASLQMEIRISCTSGAASHGWRFLVQTVISTMMGRLGIGTISWCGRERFGNQSFRFISFHPSTWRDALLSSRICRFWRAMLPHCRKTGGHGFCRAEKIFGRVGAKSEGTPPGVPKSFFFRSCRSTTLQLNPKTAANGE